MVHHIVYLASYSFLSSLRAAEKINNNSYTHYIFTHTYIWTFVTSVTVNLPRRAGNNIKVRLALRVRGLPRAFIIVVIIIKARTCPRLYLRVPIYSVRRPTHPHAHTHTPTQSFTSNRMPSCRFVFSETN